MRQTKPRRTRWGAALVTAAVAVGLGTAALPAAADGGERVIFEEDFSGGELPEGFEPVLGEWDVVDGRLQSTSGSEAARIGFGPEAPENFRLDVSAEFIEVDDAARWLAVGLDYHAADHWGAWVGLRSETTADNGVEFVQRTQQGNNALSASPGLSDMGSGVEHQLSFEVRGSSLVFSMNGEVVMTTDELIRTGGNFGFRFSLATVAFDDITITELPHQATPPSQPLNLRLAESDDTATLTWDAPEDPGTDDDQEPATITGYEVALDEAGTPEEELEWIDADQMSHTFTDLPGDAEQMLAVRATNSEELTGRVASVLTMRGAATLDGLKLELQNGPWQTSHVQGIAVDVEQEFIYYSFTTLLVKTDFAGNIIGSVGGFTGHLGDLDFNPEDGRVYGSLEYKDQDVFYVAIFDVDQIEELDMEAQDSDVLSTVYLDEITQDYIAEVNVDGEAVDHRYGTSGFDGLSFGPEFGSADGPDYLTVAYGIFGDLERIDNDHQVLLQYDVSDWAQYERPLIEDEPHDMGPEQPGGKYFVFTGNTRYGVQNLDYDPWLERWFLAVYPGSKPQYPNYEMFAVDAADPPTLEPLQGLDGEEGMLLPLADDGLEDAETGIRGWWKDGSVGFQNLGNGLYYVSEATTDGGAGSILRLECWTGDVDQPFERVDGGCPLIRVASLADSVQDYVASGDLAGPIARLLPTAITSAERHLQAGRTDPAINAMERFIRHLEAPMRSDIVTDEARDDLLPRAQELLRAID